MPGTLAGVLQHQPQPLGHWCGAHVGSLVSVAAEAGCWISVLHCSLRLPVSKPPGTKVYQ